MGFCRAMVMGKFMAGMASVCCVAALCSARAAVYHISPDGDDLQSGLSPESAWQTVGRVNAAMFAPGDQILFEGGKIFPGPVKFDKADGGSPENPVLVSSYNLELGRAIILGGEGRGIDVYNTTGLHITDLKVVGDGAKENLLSGISLLSTTEGGASHVEIERVEVSGFGRHGISIGAWKTVAGYRNVRISNCSTHNNWRTGVFTWGPWGAGIYAHRKIYIGDTEAYKMKGGSGLTFSSVDGGIIERCIVHNNGEEYSGGAGIWAWDSNDILFQYNESYENRTTGVDGDGFDFDGGVTNSIMQYNYSHDNDAAGYLLAQYKYAPQAMNNIIIRYNISENDCRKKAYGAIHVWNGDEGDRIQNIHIYQNTVYLTPQPKTQRSLISRKLRAVMQAVGLVQAPFEPSAIAVISPTTSVSVYNNIFYTTKGGRLVKVVEGQDRILFKNNAYWADNGPFNVRWMGEEYKTLAAWLKGAKDQERNGARILAINENPKLIAPGTGGTLGRAELLTTLEGYKLQSDSPLVGRGLDILQTFGVDPGSKGFFGKAIPTDLPPAIGAHLLQGS